MLGRMDTPDSGRLQASVARALHAHWGFFLAEGIALLVLGLTAIVVPPVATVAVELLIGWLILLSGVVGLIATFLMRRAPGFAWSLLSAVVGIVAGLVLLRWPLSGAFSLTVILTVAAEPGSVLTIMKPTLPSRRTVAWTLTLAVTAGVTCMNASPGVRATM